MALVYLIAGSNLGDKLSYLTRAGEYLSQDSGMIIRKSSVYESEPWGFKDERYFLNQVFVVETLWSPQNLLQKIQWIEFELGRVRGDEQYMPRTIDLDILFYDHVILNTTSLTIPHPQIQYRRFVLVPLNEIAPFFIHPLLNTSIRTLLESCSDPGIVRESKDFNI